MKAYFAAEALLPAGWRRDVRVRVDDAGNFADVQEGATADGAEVLPGPVLPGMANLHSHAFQRAMAGLTEVRGESVDDFWSWRELMYRFASRITPGQAHAIARHLYIELLRHGYTAVAEFHYLHRPPGGGHYAQRAEMLLQHLRAAREAGIAVTLLPSLYQWSDFGRRALQARQERFASSPEDIIAMVDAARGAAGENPDVRAGVAPHSLRAVDAESLRALVEALKAVDPTAPVHIHAAEQLKEVENCVAATGRRPVEWLLENMRVDRHWCLVHATHMTTEEAQQLAGTGAVAGLCPTTEANLGDGVFPLLEFRAAGGRYGVGGDSHVCRDPVEELRTVEYVQRLATRRRNLVVGERSQAVGTTLWLEAAEGGGRATGRAMGAIMPGLRADLIVLEATHPDLENRSGDALTNSFVFSGSGAMLRDVMVGGRWAIRAGRHALEESARRGYSRALRELVA
jgi:formimidoylglutamate deiminase